nr:uncharacterized protein LOC129143819 [Pan troglodytes]
MEEAQFWTGMSMAGGVVQLPEDEERPEVSGPAGRSRSYAAGCCHIPFSPSCLQLSLTPVEAETLHKCNLWGGSRARRRGGRDAGPGSGQGPRQSLSASPAPATACPSPSVAACFLLSLRTRHSRCRCRPARCRLRRTALAVSEHQPLPVPIAETEGAHHGHGARGASGGKRSPRVLRSPAQLMVSALWGSRVPWLRGRILGVPDGAAWGSQG